MIPKRYIRRKGVTYVPDSSITSFIQLPICMHSSVPRQCFGYNMPNVGLDAGDTALNKSGWCPLEEIHPNCTPACSHLPIHSLHVPAWLWMNSYAVLELNFIAFALWYRLLPCIRLSRFFSNSVVWKNIWNCRVTRAPVPPRIPLESLPGWKMFLACGYLISVSVFVHSSSPVCLSQTVSLGRHLPWMGFATHRDRTRLCLSKSLTWLHFKKFLFKLRSHLLVTCPSEAQGKSLLGSSFSLPWTP